MPPKTTAVAGKPKLSTKRIRKSRTEFVESSSSSSESEASSDTESSSSAASAAAPNPSKKQKTTTARDNSTSSASDVSSSSSSSLSDSESDALPASAAAAAFPSWYLRTVTQELAEDLDKVRGAPDFGDAALPLLVHALQQGEACFSQAEKARVMSAAARD
ncbi:Ribosome assembly protein 3 [Lasiodiplodia theobromae]|uniref:Ribosome assembly protein 3 n=1 Tax=Lasiodiplodia theobromae TaxID=45133 RepID=A0A5N5DD44_9PEZI|nr:Ribosome assembly protein 3 [Lasiodiplodia theobromae]KAB2575776.1 hypothetical protein DBV05_g5667 [Lasiodiplodia theobromae]KAF4537594.1 Ribosome assembly protein 3 [Lasiodiplodia theobromae]